MLKKSTILIVEDEEINREMLRFLLTDEYRIMEAANGQEALDVLQKSWREIHAVILDLVMPVMDGFTFLEKYQQSDKLKDIPVIVSTGQYDAATESRCLEQGAWDFIRKPYNGVIIKNRIKNVVSHSQINALKELVYRENHDQLTGLYSKDKFFRETRRMLDENPKKQFAFIRGDLQKFQMVNLFYGTEEGDRLLIFMSRILTEYMDELPLSTYGRIEADVFCMCFEFISVERIADHVNTLTKRMKAYPINQTLVPAFGVYVIDDPKQELSQIYDKANLAAKECKSGSVANYVLYRSEMSTAMVREQVILNNMERALREEDFILYLQPKYEMVSEKLAGAEVLVRWKDAQRGIISPGEFIPVFEKNGFILKLDYYVWEHTCRMLRSWLDEGVDPMPVSVNISRISLYDEKLVEKICALLEKYQIPVRYFQLELTESAYVEREDNVISLMDRFKQKGFTILMDDFGSGYSSLNALKDISVDVLKIDMRFLGNGVKPGKSENILSSVVRMAKWLNIPVVAEGVEEEQQAAFLRSIGCNYVQGFLYAKPMPIPEYEKLPLVYAKHQDRIPANAEISVTETVGDLWKVATLMKECASELHVPAAIYEYDQKEITIVEATNEYFALFDVGISEKQQQHYQSLLRLDPSNPLFAVFTHVGTEDRLHFENVELQTCTGKTIKLQTAVRHLGDVGDKKVVFSYFEDITNTKKRKTDLIEA